MVKKVVSIFFSIVLVLSLVACGMEGLPEGELEDTESNGKRNIYWEYHCEEAEVEWIDDVTVVINGHELNVLEDTYDWRDE